MSEQSDENDQLVALFRDHFPNYVTEGVFHFDPVRSTQRTRVKCDGESCDFYTADPSWFVVRDRHVEHVAAVIAAALAECDQRRLNALRADTEARAVRSLEAALDDLAPPSEGSGYCPDGCTWPHDHRFERDGVPWPARAVIPPGATS